MNEKTIEVMTYGTVLNDVITNNPCDNYFVRVTSYLYEDIVYYVTRINGEVVDFTDTSKSGK